MKENLQLSVVVTLYNSENYIREFTQRILGALKKLDVSYEIIFIDDGSKDQSTTVVKDLIESYNNIKLIKFSRNYGHHKAMVAGIENSIGKYVFLIDVDLEEPPELVLDFYNKIKKTKDDLIYGYQIKRNKDKVFGKLFWKLLNKITQLNISENVCTVRIMTKKFIKNFSYFKQKDFFLGELSSHIGLKQSSIIVNKTFKGKSSYSFFKKYTILFNMLFTNTSDLWIKLSFFSTILSFITFLVSFSLILSRILGKEYLSGWLSIMVLITFFASLNFMFFAIILQLVSKTLEEGKGKPRYLIDEKINFTNIQ